VIQISETKAPDAKNPAAESADTPAAATNRNSDETLHIKESSI
jgi:hypothetical protein